ncbi:AAEL013425-PB [Aedes aegypti]|uniref:Sm domain-containing protein n=2 Tax=Aedes aegypti TaxID=7159 RepID=J9HZX6_AEDAE|nr:U7 snRNA-associated Sm-like protein LSm10 [Aedes aegypti]XP_021708464.1 U7 snRNA-associated Sm-like protein LSm10 [Aedes aegypti]EJY58040.1 AAEL013425-PB [Aedes aegypti]
MSRLTERKERYNTLNELAGLVQCLVNRNILIDLRNESSVAGKITNVDGFMNISMENVVLIDQLGKHFRMEEFMIYPRYVRYIHIPESIEIVPALEEHIKRETTRKPRAPVKRTYKMKRAQLNQQRTLAELNAAQSETSKEQ